MKNEVLGKNIFRIAVIFLSAALLFMAWYTLHDMQKAEGIGLYYSSVLGAGGAFGLGMAAEAVGMLALAALLLLPCVLFRRLSPESFLRMLTAYLAFMPTVSLAYLVHLLNGTEKIRCSEALLAGNFGQALLEGLAGIAPVLSAGIPLMILVKFALGGKNTAYKQGVCGAERKIQGQRKVGGQEVLKRISAAMVGILMVLAVVFPVLKEVSTFFIRYLLLLYGFFLWESLCESQPRYKNWIWVIFGIFGLRGIYVMAEVMSVYHL